MADPRKRRCFLGTNISNTVDTLAKGWAAPDTLSSATPSKSVAQAGSQTLQDLLMMVYKVSSNWKTNKCPPLPYAKLANHASPCSEGQPLPAHTQIHPPAVCVSWLSWFGPHRGLHAGSPSAYPTTPSSLVCRATKCPSPSAWPPAA